jgi:hypothetical protein
VEDAQRIEALQKTEISNKIETERVDTRFTMQGSKHAKSLLTGLSNLSEFSGMGGRFSRSIISDAGGGGGGGERVMVLENRVRELESAIHEMRAAMANLNK